MIVEHNRPKNKDLANGQARPLNFFVINDLRRLCFWS